MKTNSKKGLGKKGARKITQTIRLAKVAGDANQKTTKTIIHNRQFSHRGRTFAEMVYESYFNYLQRINTPAPQDENQIPQSK